MSRLALIAITAATLAFGSAKAAVTPSPSAADPRVRIVEYVPDQVVTLNATLGYAITVNFGLGERIENVSIGDSLGWQITPNRKATILFIKPVEMAPPTNMTVVTNLRTYNFDLRIRQKRKGDDHSVIFVLKFDYPEPVIAVLEPAEHAKPPEPPEPPKNINNAYSFTGSAIGLPLAVFDDGSATYFKFSETAEYPAIFAIDPDKKEATVNVAQRNGLVVVDRLAAAFILRRGSEITRVINDGYQADQGQASALKRHKGH